MEVQILDARALMPSCLESLLSASTEEGIRNVSNLVQQWRDGLTLFDGEGEALYVAQMNGRTIGVGGVLRCKDIPGALRVSRFYVLPEWRNRGIASAIAREVLNNIGEFAEVVTCNAQASEYAPPFWESLGFIPTEVPGITHILKVSSKPKS